MDSAPRPNQEADKGCSCHKKRLHCNNAVVELVRDLCFLTRRCPRELADHPRSSVINIQDQHSNALSLVNGQRLRCDSLLRSLAVVKITQEHEQTTPGSSRTNRDATFDSGTDRSQETAANLDDFLDAASQFSEEISEALPFYTPCASLPDYSLEISGTFYPEQYVTEGPLHERLTVFSMINLNRTGTTRVDKYFLLFAKDARHWRRVTVTAMTIVESRLSEVSSTLIETCYHVLPGLVQPQLEAMLGNTQLYDSVTNICIELQSNNESDATFDPERSRIIEDLEEASIAETSKHVEEIEHRGLPQYLEKEIIVLSRINAHLYLVLVESQRCVERKLPFGGTAASDRKPVDEFFADMKLLQIAQGCPGVAKFVGVVLNDNRTQLCSYLLLYPEQGSVRKLLEAARVDDALIPWKRRERWIRQTIVAIVEIHKRGIFVGYVDLSGIWVDSNDNILIITFKSVGGHIPNRKGYMPPELRRFTAPRALATGQSLTVQSDVFQLGLFVWMLAEHVATVNGIFCRKSGCQTFPRYRCTADHVNPIELPPCGGEVPTFINIIIGHCRQEQPCQRKPASALLALLPTDHDSASFSPDRVSLDSRFFRSVTCDECGRVATDAHYHCSVCNQGDFDLCPRCVSVGISCYNDGHKLSRRVLKYCRFINETTSV
jgi:serine/threonine protein kinase